MPSLWLENVVDVKSRLKLASDQAFILGAYSGFTEQEELVSVCVLQEADVAGSQSEPSLPLAVKDMSRV